MSGVDRPRPLGLFLDLLIERCDLMLGDLALDRWWIELSPARPGEIRLRYRDRARWVEYKWAIPVQARSTAELATLAERGVREFKDRI